MRTHAGSTDATGRLGRMFVVGFVSCLGLGTETRAAVVHVADEYSVALHHFDDTVPDQFGDADFADSSGNGRHATGYDIGADAITMGTNGVTGGTDKGVFLNAASGKRTAISPYQVIGDYSGGPFTLEGWIKDPREIETAEGTLGRVIAELKFTPIAWSLGLASTGGFRLFGNNVNSFAHTTTARGWEAGRWYYVALVADTNGLPAGQARYDFYRRPLGGRLARVGSVITNAPVNNVNSDWLLYGGETGSVNTRMFKGFMDEFHFSNTARPEAYLQAHSETSSVPDAATVHAPDDDSLLLWHADDTVFFNGSTLADAEDHSGRDNPGRALGDGLDKTPQSVYLNAVGVGSAAGGAIELRHDGANIACVRTERVIPAALWNGGDLTVELWVKGVGDTDLAGTDATYGRVLVSSERLLGATPANGTGWGLALDASGRIMLGSDTTRATLAADLAWDANTWYYLALTVEADGAGAGLSRFTVYRGAWPGRRLDTVGETALPNLGSPGTGSSFYVGSHDSDLASRKLDFVFDEVHLSRAVRSRDYLIQAFCGPPVGTAVLIR